ncbi:MAG TPA: carboxypeptidase regulatory-like domain-containing protein [Acidisarcina sp.]
MLQRLRPFLALAAMAFLPICPAVVLCQTAATGTITGTVTDKSGGVIPNASITIKDLDTGTSRTLNTNGQGIYVASFLQPGTYEVVAAQRGFNAFDQKDLSLTVGQNLTLDIVLAVGSSAVTVDVQAGDAPLLDTQRTEVSQTVDQALIQNLPVASRNWTSFALLTPNVTPDGTSGLVSYRGISGLYNSNLVDGANNNQALFSEARGRASGAPYVYSLDSIREFQVETAVYSAEFGQAAGGQINAITRSGTNATHGDLFYYLRYPALNALDSYSKFQGITQHRPLLLTQPVHQQQQFGGSVGGPVIHQKLFYFFTYDGFRKVAPILYTSNANISLTPSGPTSSTSTITPTQCNDSSGNPLVSASQCTAAINYLLGLSGSYPRVQKQDIFFPRLDYQLNDRNHISVNFNFGNYKSPSGYSPGPTVSNSSITTNGTTNYHERFLIGNWSSAFTANTANEVIAQWGRDLETAGVNAPGPSVSIGNVQTYGMPNALPRTAEPDEHRIQFTDILSTTHGRHTLKVGGDLNFIHELMINLFQGGGVYSYSAAGTATGNFQNWVRDVFPASPLDPAAGTHYTTFTQVYDPITHVGKDDFWMKNYDVFAEDTWKIKPDLTFDLGVRYDLQVTPQPTHPNATSALATFYTGSLKTVKDRVVPRLGFAYNPHPGTVFRGGYGIFAALTQGSTYYAMRVENGVYQTNYNFNGYKAGTGAPVFPNVLFTPPGLPLAAPFSGAAAPQVTPGGSALITSFHGLDPNFVPPLAHEAELGLEQEMPARVTLSVGYVGTRALHLPVFVDSNLARATTTRDYAIYNSGGAQTRQITLPFYTARLTAADGSINTGFSAVNSWYNSMAVTVRRPFDHGLEVLLNYTWSKATDLGQVQGAYGTFYGGDAPIDPYNLKAEEGRSDLDQRNHFGASVVYQPMLFKNFVLTRYLINGFLFSGTATETTGFPITPGLTGYPQASLKVGIEGGLTGGVISSGSGAATAGRAPQVARNSYPGPGLRNIDFRVSRDFALHEQVRFQILGEAFNLMNHTNIFGVNTTAFSYVTPGGKLPSGGSCPTLAATGDANFNGCVAPYVSATAPFRSENSTSGLLYGARQLQVSAKLFF